MNIWQRYQITRHMFTHDTKHITGQLQNHYVVFVIAINIIVTSKWAQWRLKSPVSRLFTQSFIRA